jgi:hypothetical protein
MLTVLLSLPLTGGTRGRVAPGDVDGAIEAAGLSRPGVHLGIEVALVGGEVLFSRDPDVPRAAASAVKSAIAVDLLATRGGSLDDVPTGVDALLTPGMHPAFDGFTPEQLSHCRAELVGKSYLELARIMMGRTRATNEAYNAACNVIMVKLGGPEAIGERIAALDPALAGFTISHYMQRWNGDGDNLASPAALVALYRMTATGTVPGLPPREMEILQALLLEEGDGGPGSVYEKDGTLYPRPMVRVHAGYELREGGSLIYAVMGEVAEPSSDDPADSFLRLMNGVDAVTATCREMSPPGRR